MGKEAFRNRLYKTLARLIGYEPTKFLFRIYDIAKFDLFGVPKYGIGSIDVTYRCNLACKHCYFNEQGYSSELSEEAWLARFDSWKKSGKFPFYQCSWIGGEPLLRKDLVEKGMKYFKSNMVATNGTIPLPNWPDVNFYVSVDGTEPYYKLMRGKEHIYPIIKKNADRPELKIVVAMTVSKLNYPCIAEMLREWSKTKVKGLLFQFYTPIEGQDDSELYLGWELRDRIIDQILHLKRTYDDFIINPEPVLRLMKSDRAPEITRRCQYSKISYAFGPDGKLKKPCMMGEKADCTACGCVLPFHQYLLSSHSLLFRELLMYAKRLLSERWRAAMRMYA